MNILELIPIEIFSNDIGKPEHDEYIKCGNYYEHYYSLSQKYKPESILEIGVRYGYSLCSMVAGSIDTVKYVEGWDNDSYSFQSIKIAKDNLVDHLQYKGTYKFMKADSHEVALNQHFDLIHIDGDHSYQGKLLDLELVKNICKTLIVDDYHHISWVGDAVNLFVAGNTHIIENTYIIDSIRGTFVIEFKQ